ncbi:MAG: hypothetical protein R3D67_09700 [Hyphomicrobiaceae bacterium]
MSSSRLLLQLFVLSLGLLGAAVVLTTGGMPWPSLPFVSGETGVALPQATFSTLNGLLSAPGMLTGFVLGWGLHWLYSLPWGAIPRAIADWLLGWRQSAAMTLLALGCLSVLLLV